MSAPAWEQARTLQRPVSVAGHWGSQDCVPTQRNCASIRCDPSRSPDRAVAQSRRSLADKKNLWLTDGTWIALRSIQATIGAQTGDQISRSDAETQRQGNRIKNL